MFLCYTDNQNVFFGQQSGSRFAELHAQYFEALAPPNQSRFDIFKRKSPILRRHIIGNHFNIVAPCDVSRWTIKTTHGIFQPRTVAPAGILKTHAHGKLDAAFETAPDKLGRVVPRFGLPCRIFLQSFAPVSRDSHKGSPIRTNPVHQVFVETGGVTSPAGIGIAQHGISVSKTFQDLWKTTGKTGFFNRIGCKYSVRKVLLDFGYP